jgi:hypothetical protein
MLGSLPLCRLINYIDGRIVWCTYFLFNYFILNGETMWWHTPVHFYLHPPQIYKAIVNVRLETSLISLFDNIEIFWEAKCLICNNSSYEAVIYFSLDKLITSLRIRSRPRRPLYTYILHQLYIKSLVIFISQSQLLLVSLIFDNCQLFYVVISTYNQLVFDQLESGFYNMTFRLCCPFVTILLPTK